LEETEQEEEEIQRRIRSTKKKHIPDQTQWRRKNSGSIEKKETGFS
jgi:hypothetical protein